MPAFDAKRVFLNRSGLGEYGRHVIRAVTGRYAEIHPVLYTPAVDQWLRAEVPAEAAAAIRRPPHGLRHGAGAAYWRTFRLGRRAARDGATIFHGLTQELPRDLPRRLPAVVSVLDLIPFRFPDQFTPVDRRVYQWKIAHAAARADLVITPSRRTAADLEQYCGVEQSRVRVIPIGVQPRFRIQVSVEEVRGVCSRYGVEPGFALAVGRLEPRKNPLLLLRALRRLRAAERPQVVFVGRDAGRRGRLDAYLREHGLKPWTTLVGEIAPADLPALYQAAAVLVYPTLFEGFGIPVLEAMVSGTPVITTRGSGPEEVGGDAPLYIDPQDPDDLAAALTKVLSDSETASAMAEGGRRRAEAFRDERLAEELMEAWGLVTH